MEQFNYEQSIWGKGEVVLSLKDPAYFRLFQALKMTKILKSESKVLEIGCGAGQFIRAIKRYFPSLQCFGCDISNTAIKEAKNYSSSIEYALNQNDSLPYPNDSMDGVYIFDVLEHVDNPEVFLKEIYRVLKPGGLFYSFVPCEGDWLSGWHMLDIFGLKRNLTKKYAGHIQYFSRRQLIGLYKKNNFAIVSKRYSEHILGQCIGIISFFLMDRFQKKTGAEQLNNEFFFNDLDQNKKNKPFFSWIKNTVNRFIALESRFFSHIPSPNIHLVVSKE